MIIPDGFSDSHCALRVLIIPQAESAASLEMVAKVLVVVVAGMNVVVTVGVCAIVNRTSNASAIVMNVVTRILQTFLYYQQNPVLGLGGI